MLSAFTRAARRSRPASLARRAFAADADAEIKVEFPGAYEGHLIDTLPTESALTNKAELFDYLKMMSTMRRMEITLDYEYKANNVRGFCHL